MPVHFDYRYLYSPALMKGSKHFLKYLILSAAITTIHNQES